MVSMIGELRVSVLNRLELARAAIAAGGDLEAELTKAMEDIGALCEETDLLYCDTVTSMW
jgi:hypothetical protein